MPGVPCWYKNIPINLIIGLLFKIQPFWTKYEAKNILGMISAVCLSRVRGSITDTTQIVFRKFSVNGSRSTVVDVKICA